MFDHDCFLPHKFLTCDSFRNVMGMGGHSLTGKGHFIFQESYYISIELLGTLCVVHFNWTEVSQRILEAKVKKFKIWRHHIHQDTNEKR
jgi:hypothetical protein